MMMMMREGSSSSGGGGGFISTGSTRCQDCGNQAKKECVYMRCRTCCKSKGFHCQTHVKSTWVPLYRRRHRQQQQLLNTATTTIHQQQHLLDLHHQGHISNPNRLRKNLSSAGLIEDHQDHDHHDFPAEVKAMATFHMVRVSSVVDHQQYAYQTSVSIGGHVFKGILYDQGPDHHQISSAYSSLAVGDQTSQQLIHDAPPAVFHHPNFVNLITSTKSASSAINLIACTSSPPSSSAVATDQRPLFAGSSSSSSSYPMFLHPPPSTGVMMSGMQFFPNRK